jgi:hypothetical protein
LEQPQTVSTQSRQRTCRSYKLMSAIACKANIGLTPADVRKMIPGVSLLIVSTIHDASGYA